MASANPAPACSPNTNPPNPAPTVLKRHFNLRAFMDVARSGEGDELTVGTILDANKRLFILRSIGRTGDARKAERAEEDAQQTLRSDRARC